jgi:hypothetical protein
MSKNYCFTENVAELVPEIPPNSIVAQTEVIMLLVLL